ncbi:GNAT family N-acetyltransferase [Salinimicrobium xinjiangense]|uniref:GNAT family N-acetyltransferase n=1 Tax=Salinimicrobium xinjiangense TaxID=438596 RepID=UPI000417D748|nr:GNAT family N-acetyltransferase [Salinimicrobium xinjiangense]
MKIKDLSSTPFEEIITCFLKAFEGYFVQLPEDIVYWRSRFIIARVDWSLSFGMFDGDKLVGYIINGIDQHNGKLTAYNTGTGVLAEYRGKAIVDQLYDHAVPLLKDRKIEKCLLEVICENERAIKVYERIGFKIIRHLRTFSGNLPETTSENRFQKCHFSQVLNSGLYKPEHYAWDNSAEAIKMSDNIRTFCLGKTNSPEAYFSIDPAGNVIQLESTNADYEYLLGALGNVAGEVKLKNLDAQRSQLIKALQKLHFSNPVNQYEMEMLLEN